MNTQFETWWYNEGSQKRDMKEACRTAWENGAYCALNPITTEYDDLNEPLGPACQLSDESCESCQ